MGLHQRQARLRVGQQSLRLGDLIQTAGGVLNGRETYLPILRRNPVLLRRGRGLDMPQVPYETGAGVEPIGRGGKMMITKDKEYYYLYCDICGEDSGEVFNDFFDAVEYKDRQGWKSRKRRGEWEDVCPGCQEAGAKLNKGAR